MEIKPGYDLRKNIIILISKKISHQVKCEFQFNLKAWKIYRPVVVRNLEIRLDYIDFFLIQKFKLIIFSTIKSESKHLNLKRIKFFLTWFKVPMKLISINLKWSIAMICYNKSALYLDERFLFVMVLIRSNTNFYILRYI